MVRRTTFKRIGVTEGQLDKYNLRHLTNPDPAIIRKLSKPGNYYAKPFKEHFGSVFQIELEVLDALPDFDNILREEVELLYGQVELSYTSGPMEGALEYYCLSCLEKHVFEREKLEPSNKEKIPEFYGCIKGDWKALVVPHIK